ncbi:MAG: class I mannose-6-phosphate isomerase [Opitutus sp.]
MPSAHLTGHERPRGLVRLPPNRVWRTYTGGRTLNQLNGRADGDSHFPEDWIGSTTRAVNIGRESIPEGVSHVQIGAGSYDLAALVAADATYFLGDDHVARFGAAPQLLVKFIDSAVRLHFQVHPTAEFAHRCLGSPSGKTEAYHVLSTRPEVGDPCIYLGFQRPPSRDALRGMILRQDIAAIQSCFDPIRVQPGDTFVVPGGVPHALGAGVFLIEVQEPSDLVVRFEFERGGVVLPEAARFMGRGLDFCLDVFDFTSWSHRRVAAEAACPPKRRRAVGPDSWQDDLVDSTRTPCFGVRRTRLGGVATKQEMGFHIGIVTSGAVVLSTSVESHRFAQYEKFLIPAGLGPVRYAPEGTAEILECYPPRP